MNDGWVMDGQGDRETEEKRGGREGVAQNFFLYLTSSCTFCTGTVYALAEVREHQRF